MVDVKRKFKGVAAAVGKEIQENRKRRAEQDKEFREAYNKAQRESRLKRARREGRAAGNRPSFAKRFASGGASIGSGILGESRTRTKRKRSISNLNIMQDNFSLFDPAPRPRRKKKKRKQKFIVVRA